MQNYDENEVLRFIRLTSTIVLELITVIGMNVEHSSVPEIKVCAKVVNFEVSPHRRLIGKIIQ